MTLDNWKNEKTKLVASWIINTPEICQSARNFATEKSAFWCSKKADIHCSAHAFSDEFFGEDEFVGEVDNGDL